ncbi:hypothetical protein K432DRAFT_141326 [Lepidopterella palustris CBS 459.81]|uniref:Uncharacterized protein n=1 Tax=Lepidopterella palustris CBS 459.81 TaxID=1314670 RepID=A0A8E2E3L4_9PEZI|nr:hypothetical protein K432DRAFT_141326 [Lepidopterella palustris CBS 459.81]
MAPNPSPPPKIRAYTHTTRGAPSTVLSLTTIPTITLPSQTLIRISHCALNPGASIMLHQPPTRFRTRPCITELDFSGTALALGDAVNASRGTTRQLAPTDRVFGSITIPAHLKGSSGLTKYVLLEAATVVKVSLPVCATPGVLPEGVVESYLRQSAGRVEAYLTACPPSIMQAASLSEKHHLGTRARLDHIPSSPPHHRNCSIQSQFRRNRLTRPLYQRHCHRNPCARAPHGARISFLTRPPAALVSAAQSLASPMVSTAASSLATWSISAN